MKVVYLSDFDGRRDNNFTVLRLLFASAVLFGHSWPVVGVSGHDPISNLFAGYVWIGEIAVNGFFVISGFLVTGSLIRRGAIDYAISRFLRIWPGLVVCVLLSVCVLGLWTTSLPSEVYSSDKKTWNYASNIFLWPRIYWYLPGVFESHPDRAVNGSLWTLPPESACYFLLAIAGMLGALKDKWRVSAISIWLVVLGYVAFASMPVVGTHASWARPMAHFVIGVLVWVYRQQIIVHWLPAVVAVAITTIMIATGVPKSLFYPAFSLCLAYLIFFAAFGTKHIEADRFPGDISYGIYIYAWPCQQIVFAQGQSPWSNAMLAACLTIPLATASWYFIEKPALSLKRSFLGIGSRLRTSAMMVKWPTG